MKNPVQVAFTDIPVDDEAEALCHRLAEKLEQHCGELTSCRVVISRPHRHRRNGNVYEVKIHLALAHNGTITVDHKHPSHERDQHPLPMIREAFQIMERQIENKMHKRTDLARSRETPVHDTAPVKPS